MGNPIMKYFNSSAILHRILYAVAIALLALILGILFYRERAISSKAISSILLEYNEESSYAQIMIDYPLNDTVFPPEIPPPTFRWVNLDTGSDRWLLSFEFQDKFLPQLSVG